MQTSNRLKSFEQTHTLWEAISARPELQISPAITREALIAVASGGNVTLAKDTLARVLSSGQKVAPETIAPVLLGFGAIRDWEGALEQWEMAKKQGLHISAVSYAAMFDAALKCGQNQFAGQLYREMKEQRIQPGARQLQRLLEALATGENDHLALASKIWKDVPEDIKDPRLYEALIRVYASKGMHEECKLVLFEMNKKKMRPTDGSFKFAIEACVASGSTYACDQMHEFLLSNAFTWKFDFFQESINALVAVGNFQEALRQCQENPDKITPDTFNLVLSGSVDHSQFDIAAEILTEMKKAGFPYNHRTLVLLTKTYSSFGACSKFLRILELAKLKEISSPVLLTNMLVGLKQNHEYSLGETIWNSFLAIGGVPDPQSYSHYISVLAYGRNMDLAMKILAEMKSRGFTPSIDVYAALVQGVSFFQSDHLLSVLTTEVKLMGLRLSRDFVVNVMYSHLRCGSYRLGIQTFNLLQENGFEPDRAAFSALIQLLYRDLQFERCIEVYKEAEQILLEVPNTALKLVYSAGNLLGDEDIVRKIDLQRNTNELFV
jgi:pentatricopeptide repeat protein